jgi:hypothetical protein
MEKQMKTMIYLSTLMIFLCACNGAMITQTPIPDPPTLTATPSPLPTATTTSTLPPPQASGFPYAAVLNDELPIDGLILAAHVYGDNVCYDLGVYQDNTYIALSCLPEFTYPAASGVLDAYEASYIQLWAERYQSYEMPSVHGLLKFQGNGTLVPDEAEKISMETLLSTLELLAHNYVVPFDGRPRAVYVAQKILAQQLGIPLDKITILNFDTVDFPDTCLGLPKPDELCAQVITSGFLIQLAVDGLMYEFHTDLMGYDIRQSGEPQIAPTPFSG